MIARRRMTSLALAGLLVAGGASAQEGAGTQTLKGRIAAWKLKAATGVPGTADLAELEELLESLRATGGSPELIASLSESTAKLRKRLNPTPNQARSTKVSAAAEKEVLRLALERAVAENNVGFIDSLGVRAVPALRELAA